MEELGTALFSTWAVPFEIASVVLLVALLGALQIAARRPDGATDGMGDREGAASLMVPLEHILVFSATMFAIGAYGVMARRNAVLVFMAVELMLNAVAINLVAFSTRIDPQRFSGIVFAIFVITVAPPSWGWAWPSCCGSTACVVGQRGRARHPALVGRAADCARDGNRDRNRKRRGKRGRGLRLAGARAVRRGLLLQRPDLPPARAG